MTTTPVHSIWPPWGLVAILGNKSFTTTYTLSPPSILTFFFVYLCVRGFLGVSQDGQLTQGSHFKRTGGLGHLRSA